MPYNLLQTYQSISGWLAKPKKEDEKMQIQVIDKTEPNKTPTTVEVADKIIKAVGAFYVAAQLRKHLKDNSKLPIPVDGFEVKIPGKGRRKLSEGEKWANKFAKLSPEAQAEVQAAIPKS